MGRSMRCGMAGARVLPGRTSFQTRTRWSDWLLSSLALSHSKRKSLGKVSIMKLHKICFFFVPGLGFDQGQTVPHLICCLALPFSFDLNFDVCSWCDTFLRRDCFLFLCQWRTHFIVTHRVWADDITAMSTLSPVLTNFKLLFLNFLQAMTIGCDLVLTSKKRFWIKCPN